LIEGYAEEQLATGNKQLANDTLSEMEKLLSQTQ
jgi:hypothetical protein